MVFHVEYFKLCLQQPRRDIVSRALIESETEKYDSPFQSECQKPYIQSKGVVYTDILVIWPAFYHIFGRHPCRFVALINVNCNSINWSNAFYIDNNRRNNNNWVRYKLRSQCAYCQTVYFDQIGNLIDLYFIDTF